MAYRVDRTMLESVFPADDLVTLAGAALDVVLHESAREFLRDVGLPDKSWFEVSTELRNGAPEFGFEVVGEQFPELDFAFERWMFLGHVGFDTIGLDTTTGQVYVVPNGRAPHLFHGSIDEFVYVLYLLEVERPNYDFEKFGYDEDDPEAEEDEGFDPGAEDRLRAQISAVDPTTFERPGSTWELVLERVAADF
jgi:hypothetical protein